mmetsp:Transcript_16733/g.33979  ORF Transcript_16733/g.33979 Transcript_16733/m.33979 type:complete len:102 (-) Transcript_16733:2034-2339(-)
MPIESVCALRKEIPIRRKLIDREHSRKRENKKANHFGFECRFCCSFVHMERRHAGKDRHKKKTGGEYRQPQLLHSGNKETLAVDKPTTNEHIHVRTVKNAK